MKNPTKPFRHEVAVQGGKLTVTALLFAGSDLEPNLMLGISHKATEFQPGDEAGFRRHFMDAFYNDLCDMTVVFASEE